ncbi:hypothetical protein [Pararhodobacter oceanensis]|uniref:Uncharacterized protein n=1 Tax=Pararhodobacter oceanensis TaxID=2172121 RepID=A0A2T8HP68_9RHOB|nr:hypothetical protein [Pararhodobacter oceanensis]PVH27227.1 hypothetical protein DDE20_18730 [Pararhodobacter oceanensis]
MLHSPYQFAFDWKDLLQRGDVVMFRFPVSEDDAPTEPPKARPCLVLDVIHRRGGAYVELAYGTTSEGGANRGYEVLVKQAASRAAAGLDKPTRFVGARRITVRIDHAGFECSADELSPIIGRLDAPLLDRMNNVRARIQAEADIAAHYREERRQVQTRGTLEDRGFH